MCRACTILGVILILISTGCASYTPEEERACRQLVTSTTSVLHPISGNVYILHGDKQGWSMFGLDDVIKNCLFIEKDAKGNIHLQCGDTHAVNPTCVEKLRNDLEKARQQLKND